MERPLGRPRRATFTPIIKRSESLSPGSPHTASPPSQPSPNEGGRRRFPRSQSLAQMSDFPRVDCPKDHIPSHLAERLRQCEGVSPRRVPPRRHGDVSFGKVITRVPSVTSREHLPKQDIKAKPEQKVIPPTVTRGQVHPRMSDLVIEAAPSEPWEVP